MSPRPLYVITFDVNVYLRVAQALGEPVTWNKFLQEAPVIARSNPLTVEEKLQVDCVRALSMASSSNVRDPIELEVWVSDHILDLVEFKAAQPNRPGLEDEKRGLGWSQVSAEQLVDELVWGVVEESNGDSAGHVFQALNHPPLDHEDGVVYQTSLVARDRDVFCERIVVTGDNDFKESCRGLNKYHPRVIRPDEFVAMMRGIRNQSMPKPRAYVATKGPSAS